jgi:hypothetical protein
MEDVYIFYNIIEIVLQKNNQDKKRKVFWPFEILNGICTIV